MLNHTIYVATLQSIFLLLTGEFDSETAHPEWYLVSFSPFPFHGLEA